MKLRTTLSLLLLSIATCCSIPSLAQDKQETTEKDKKEISIGSRVLKQEGESEYAYKNEFYTYNKVWEVPNTTKAELYDRTLQWMKNITGAKISELAEDNVDKNSLGVTIHLDLPDHAMMHQTVSFRFVFSFKENKIRLQGDGFKYYGDWDNGYKSRQVTTAYGTRSQQYLDAGEYNKEFHNLRPMLKGQMRTIYKEFDERYLKIVRSMKAKVLKKDENNW